ncbi:MAG: hypothetical protein JSU95_14650 [Betaproteobacteria bacterium]|nr:MAG: hypothetical protein JSU95_14650 [Betaproteobacteria bacterium]
MIRVQKKTLRNVTRVAAMMAAGVALVAASGCTSRPPAPSLDEVVQMSSEGVADDQIISRLEESRAVYQLSASGIVDLEQRGVSTAVLDYMQESYIRYVRRQERMMYGEPFWGYPCPGCRYPYWRVPPYYFPY